MKDCARLSSRGESVAQHIPHTLSLKGTRKLAHFKWELKTQVCYEAPARGSGLWHSVG